MIRLGLRLTLNGGREAAARLALIAVAVAIGVSMLLITLAGINAVNSQNARYAWLETGSPGASPAGNAGTSADPLWWSLNADAFAGAIIGRVEVAATGPDSPVPPGIAALPGPGEFYVSPALGKLLKSTPSAQLGARYPGKQIGTIGPAALPSPESLVIVIGRPARELSTVAGVHRVTSISTTVPSSCNGGCYFIGIDAAGIDLILAVAAAALLSPVLIFVAAATRLSAARREQRFAAMRLVGATPRQISVISAVESTLATVCGLALGFALFFVLRPALTGIPFTGARFKAYDLRLNVLDVLIVAFGVPLLAVIAARLALRRVNISPLGVSRRVTPRPPRAWRLLPALAGIAELAYFSIAGRPKSTLAQTWAYTAGILILMAGLVIAGPWLTMVGSKLMTRRAQRAATVVAARRLSDNPQAAFRAVSGLVLALFVTSVAVGIMTTMNANRNPPVSAAGHTTLVDRFESFGDDRADSSTIAALSAPLMNQLRSIAGVRALTVVYADASSDQGRFGPSKGLVSCAQLVQTPALGRCTPGAETAMIDRYFGPDQADASKTSWPAAAATSQELKTLPVLSIAVATDGSSPAIERARTVLQLTFANRYLPLTLAETSAQDRSTQLSDQYQRLVDVVILASLPIAGCSLAVSVAAGLSERKRPFSLLRLTGVPLRMLRRVVALEAAVPLLASAVVSTLAGFLAAGLFVDSQLGYSLRAPGVAYYVMVVVGIVASLVVVSSTLPLLKRLTGPEVARND
jgi:hypothetical protein